MLSWLTLANSILQTSMFSNWDEQQCSQLAYTCVLMVHGGQEWERQDMRKHSEHKHNELIMHSPVKVQRDMANHSLRYPSACDTRILLTVSNQYFS